MNSIPLLRPFLAVLMATLLVSGAVAGTKDNQKVPPISDKTRVEIVRLLNAEYVWVRKPFPMGEKGLSINPNGEVTPGDSEIRQLVAKYGPAARPGERAQITNVLFKNNGIWFEINGGPKKKSKWYQRISVGTDSTMATPAAQDPKELVAKGSYLVIQFPNYIPEISLTEIKDIVKPVLDFTVKSAAQAYTESLPENVRNAIRDHKVLVGMNKEMVTYAKGRPPQRLRDREGTQDYEEWIFGTPPQDVEFIRFIGDNVTQVKTMTIDGQKIVKTTPEVKLDEAPKPPPVESKADDNAAPKPKPPGAPTLRRPGEVVEDQPGMDSKAPKQRPPAQPGGQDAPPPVPKTGPGL